MIQRPASRKGADLGLKVATGGAPKVSMKGSGNVQKSRGTSANDVRTDNFTWMNGLSQRGTRS